MERTVIKVSSLSFLLLLSLFLFSFQLRADKAPELFYYAFGDKITLALVGGKYMVNAEPAFQELLKERFFFEDFSSKNDHISHLTLLKDERSTVEELLAYPQVKSVNAVYKTEEGLELSFSNEVILKYYSHVGKTERENIEKKFNLVKIQTSELCELHMLPKTSNTLRIANLLYETGLFEYAYPNFSSKIELYDNYLDGDPYFKYQIALRNTGQVLDQNYNYSGIPGADINAVGAWELIDNWNSSLSEVVVAVFDSGIPENHEDLPASRQLRLPGSNFGSGNVNDPSPRRDLYHGIACAGILAATRGNGKGIAGVAQNAKVMPVKWDDYSTDFQMAQGIGFASNNGAKIISNSWGISVPAVNYSPVIVDAIRYAIGRGVLVLFAAGNTAARMQNGSNGFVSFPANRDTLGFITVGASDRYDLQADYSPTGNYLDLVAPSHRRFQETISSDSGEMWTLDLPGDAGANVWNPGGSCSIPPYDNPDYNGTFGGTSFATPIVAGVAALVWGISPNIRAEDVQRILNFTADKIGPYVYSASAATNWLGRSVETGYGRVNAYRAVKATMHVDIYNKSFDNCITPRTNKHIYLEGVTLKTGAEFMGLSTKGITILPPFKAEAGSVLELYVMPEEDYGEYIYLFRDNEIIGIAE